MVGIYHESDERLDVFPASNHIVLVIIFFGIDQFESYLKFFLGNVIDEMYDMDRLSLLLFQPWELLDFRHLIVIQSSMK